MKTSTSLLICLFGVLSIVNGQDEARLNAAQECCLAGDGCCQNIIRQINPISMCTSIPDKIKTYECVNKKLYPEQKWLDMTNKDALCTIVFERIWPELMDHQKTSGCAAACHAAAKSPSLSNDDITNTLRISCTLQNQRYKCYRRCLDQLADGIIKSPYDCECQRRELQVAGYLLGPTKPSPTINYEPGMTWEQLLKRAAEAI
ncbi:unnamed protein product, partial [Mesorhabditis spiculigera]